MFKKFICSIYIIVSLTFIVGCYIPERVVKYESTRTTKEKNYKPPRIVISNPKQDQQRGITVIEAGRIFNIEGMVIGNSEIAHFSIDDVEVPIMNDGSFSYNIKINQGRKQFHLYAIDVDNNKTHKTINIEGEVALINRLITETKPIMRKPTLWVLSVGISHYKNSDLNLSYADHDALTISSLLKRQEGLIFKEVFTETLINEKATRGNILTLMSTHLAKAAPDDVIFIFIAGHGIKNKQTGSYYFVPYNAHSENLIYEGLKWSDFDEAIKIISGNVNKVILVLDTCHSGAITVAMRDISVGEDLAEKMKSSSGLFVLSASKSGENSIEHSRYKLPGETKGHGAFTYAILKGLKGDARQGNKSYITINDLFSYVSAQVPRITNGQQHPYSKIEGTDLPIATFK